MPIQSLYEKNGFSFNLEGRLRKLNKVVSSKVNTRSLELFFGALLQFQGEYDDFSWEQIWNFEEEINFKVQLEKVYPTFLFNLIGLHSSEVKGTCFPFAPAVSTFYLNDVISKNSTTMA